eukprot:TRINITY_DN79_c0_g2_i2.p2 TRINITY_DN79_c0_g2~~TRINITY_DN79_c0_g2_i2.p2  ORF type:complete len:468 (+),score=185.54 TRINITY_DN79_c0_g2_i2:77-1405(+)
MRAVCLLAAAAAAAPAEEWCAGPSAPESHTPAAPERGAEFRGWFRDLALWLEPKGRGAARNCTAFLSHTSGSDGLWVIEFDHSLDLWREEQQARRKGVPVLLKRGLTMVVGGGEKVPERLGYDACGQETDKRVISVPSTAVRGPAPMPTATRTEMLRQARRRNPKITDLLARVSKDTITATLSHMQDYLTRNSYSGQNGLDQAADWAEERLRSYGFAVTRNSFRSDMTPQIVAELKGTEEPEKIVVAGAHYDSRGTMSSSPTQRAPGADDNGSGSASLVEFARIIKEAGVRFRYTLRLMLFTGEEQGLIGSRALARDYASNGVNVIAMFNADMLGYKQPNSPITLALMDRYIDKDLTEIAIETTKTYVPELPVGWTSGCCSDQQSFYENGFPSAGFFETPGAAVYYPQYHRSDDLMENIDLDQVKMQATALMASAALWAEPL